eukprot:4579388-Prymnesium_polylepis.1
MWPACTRLAHAPPGVTAAHTELPLAARRLREGCARDGCLRGVRVYIWLPRLASAARPLGVCRGPLGAAHTRPARARSHRRRPRWASDCSFRGVRAHSSVHQLGHRGRKREMHVARGAEPDVRRTVDVYRERVGAARRTVDVYRERVGAACWGASRVERGPRASGAVVHGCRVVPRAGGQWRSFGSGARVSCCENGCAERVCVMSRPPPPPERDSRDGATGYHGASERERRVENRADVASRARVGRAELRLPSSPPLRQGVNVNSSLQFRTSLTGEFRPWYHVDMFGPSSL